jgi:uncharacterized membrane-anchored protein YjiN (DUF445 family)
MPRKIKVGCAFAAVLISFSIFMLASMSGPHQLDFLFITAVCDAALIGLAAI